MTALTDLTEVLSVEVEKPTDGLQNLLANPSGGDLGAWAWQIAYDGTMAGVTHADGGAALEFTAGAASGGYPVSELIPVTPGQYIGGSWNVLSLSPGTYYNALFYWYTAAGENTGFSFEPPYANVVGYAATNPVAVPAGVAYAALVIQVSSTTPGYTKPTSGTKVRFREATVATAATAAALGPSRLNMLTNPSWETNTAGWSVSGGTMSRVSDPAHPAKAGAYRLKVTPTTPTTPAKVRSGRLHEGVKGGSQYAFSIDRLGSPQVPWGLTLEFRDYSGVLLSTPTVTVPGNVARGSIRAQAPDTAYTVLAQVTLNSEAWLDAARLSEADGFGDDYFDGDTPDTAQTDYGWTGTPHASTSTANASKLPYIPPITYQEVLGSTIQAGIQRKTFDSTLNVIIKDATLDPVTADLLRPGRRVRVRTLASAGKWENLFQGRLGLPVVDYDLKRAKEGKEATITLPATGVGAILAATPESRGVAHLADLRGLLAGVPVPFRVDGLTTLAAGGVVVASTNDQATLLDQVILARDSDLGYAWTSRNGVLYAQTDRQADPYGGGTVTLDESAYSNLSVTFDPASCINSVKVVVLESGEGGQVEEMTYGPYVNLASQRKWGVQPREYRVHGVSDPAAYAQAILDANPEPTLVVNSLRLPIRDTSDLTAARALLDLYTPVRVVNQSKQLDVVLRPTGVSHAITSRGKWYLDLEFTGDDQMATPGSVSFRAASGPGGVPWASWSPSASSVASGSFVKLTTMTGREGGLEVVSGEVTAPTAGRYLVVFTAGYQANGAGDRLARVTKNGALLGQGRVPALTSTGSRTVATYVDEVTLAAGDKLAFLAYHTAGSGTSLSVDADISRVVVRRMG